MTLDQRSREAYEAWHRDLPVDEEAEMPWHRLLRQHLDLPRDIAGRVVLEVGCGRGDLSRWLASRPAPPRLLVAADFAGSAVSKGAGFARRRNLGGIDWEVADITRLPFPDNTFETVLSCETVEHVPHPERAFHELARVLKPGGRLLLTTPNYLSTSGLYRLYCRLRGRVYQEAGQPVNNLMMLPWTRALARRAGLRVTVADAIGHLLLLPARPPVEIHFPDRWRFLTRWFALYSIVVAEKP
jgi:SAM-dependent methyltransferase